MYFYFFPTKLNIWEISKLCRACCSPSEMLRQFMQAVKTLLGCWQELSKLSRIDFWSVSWVWQQFWVWKQKTCFDCLIQVVDVCDWVIWSWSEWKLKTKRPDFFSLIYALNSMKLNAWFSIFHTVDNMIDITRFR